MGYEKNDTDTFVCGAAAFGLRQAAGTAETTSADAPVAVTETTAQTSAPKTTPGGVDKAETVYAKADADGHRDRDHGGSCAEGPRRRDD